jgi:hypothetical protein
VETLESVILRRGSTRMMRHAQVPRRLLDWPMSVAVRPVPDNSVMSAGRLRHIVAIHDVDEQSPGFYRWEAGELTPILTGDEAGTRGRSRRLCLQQPLGGDSGYTAFHCTDLSRLLDRARARDYRTAQLAAGIAASRLGLAAFALGFGATELTFLDDEVSELVGLDCMLVTSVGVPAHRSKPGGRPGKPTELTGMNRLRKRLMAQLDESS